MQPFWGKHPGLEKTLGATNGDVDRMQAQSEKKYGRGLDQQFCRGSRNRQGKDVGNVGGLVVSLEGAVQDTFAREARKCHCYVVAPTYLLEDRATKRCSNAAILFDRKGKVMGFYRKLQLVVDTKTGSMEHEPHPGKKNPSSSVFRQAWDTDLLRHGF